MVTFVGCFGYIIHNYMRIIINLFCARVEFNILIIQKNIFIDFCYWR